MELTKQDQNELEPYWQKVTYTVVTSGQQCTVTAHLPKGFTMRTYNRIFNLRHAPSLNMTDAEYILFQQGELFKDLLARVAYKGIPGTSSASLITKGGSDEANNV